MSSVDVLASKIEEATVSTEPVQQRGGEVLTLKV